MTDSCPHCGLSYQRFRTGLTYRDVYIQFWSGDPDPSTWVNKRRRTVLGRWHEIKQDMWGEHLWMCEKQGEWEQEQRRLEDEVPF